MLKHIAELRSPDPYFSGRAGFVAGSLEELHEDMRQLDLQSTVPENVRRCHDAIRHTYIYAFFSYDLLTVAAAQTFPCLELALRQRIGSQFVGRTNRKGNPAPAMLAELLKTAEAQGLLTVNVSHLAEMRNVFAHGSDAVLNPPLFLSTFRLVTELIRLLYA